MLARHENRQAPLYLRGRKTMNAIFEKVFSGRYFLTLCVGVTFAYTAIKGILPADVSSIIIVMVAKDYFTKKTEP